MKEMLIVVQLMALLLQVCCLGYSIYKNVSPYNVLYGYAIWGVIPNILVGMVAIGL